MTRRLTSVLTGFLLITIGASAQTNPPPASPSPPASQPERFLLVCDTSAGMKRRAQAVEQTAADLILSGMNSHLRPGDRVGVWTFNEQLYAGQFPMLTWTPESKQAAATRLVEFLKAQKYQKKANFAVVGQGLRPIMENTERITVVLISDGSTPMRGSRFDAQINAAYAEYQRAMKKPASVLVTVLRARRGQLVVSSVNLSPWPPEFPPYPPEPSAPESKLLTNANPKAPVKLAAPIILDMSKKASPEPVTNTPPATTTTNMAPEPLAIPTKPESAPIEQAPEPTAATVALPDLSAQPTQTDTTKAQTAQLAPPTQPDPILKPTEPPTGLAVTPAKAEPPHKAEVVAPAASVAMGTKPVPVAAETASTEPEAKAASPEVAASAQPVQTAVVTPAAPVVAGKRPLVVALVLLLAALALVVIVFVRHRPRPGSSLITRSLDHDNK